MKPALLSALSALSNEEILSRLRCLAQREREATAELVAHLAELDERRLYLSEGYSSMFTYATHALHLSESAAYRRIEVARAVRRFPVLLEKIEQGAVNLTTVVMLAPHLTSQNHLEVLEAARHKSKREVEELVARLRPLPPIPSSVRKLPVRETTAAAVLPPLEPRAAGVAPLLEPFAGPTALGQAAATPLLPAVVPRRSAVVTPLAPERYRIQFTASAELHAKLGRAQDLLRHVIPDGDPAAIFERALSVLLADLEKRKLAATDRLRKGRPTAAGSRHIPAEVRRKVWERDGGQCTFVGRDGTRCAEKGGLELDHALPYALGGNATVDGIRLRCRAHNRYTAELIFGSMRRKGVQKPSGRDGLGTRLEGGRSFDRD